MAEGLSHTLWQVQLSWLELAVSRLGQPWLLPTEALLLSLPTPEHLHPL